ncbi:hypothetical protein CO683_39185 [Bradyrhizobium ottawaense]|uniref:hypothetical protein n=1 Tax=Bradyrhizobium ottawaense TaxID=931866 RepID=UPI000BE9B099|nr:hypothetical protein [Bradyrhizobium ottawaense]PDT64280.1 hypothetical protein CO683_39185 [Bradyrhizobium ottawaense]
MANRSSTKSKKPTHEAFVAIGEGESAFWAKLGAAWPHDDGKGFNVELIALPVSGRIVIRERKAGTA